MEAGQPPRQDGNEAGPQGAQLDDNRPRRRQSEQSRRMDLDLASPIQTPDLSTLVNR